MLYLCSTAHDFTIPPLAVTLPPLLYSSVFTWQAYNALFIVRCVCKLLIQHLSEDEVIEVLQTSPTPTEEGKFRTIICIKQIINISM